MGQPIITGKPEYDKVHLYDFIETVRQYNCKSEKDLGIVKFNFNSDFREEDNDIITSAKFAYDMSFGKNAGFYKKYTCIAINDWRFGWGNFGRFTTYYTNAYFTQSLKTFVEVYHPNNVIISDAFSTSAVGRIRDHLLPDDDRSDRTVAIIRSYQAPAPVRSVLENIKYDKDKCTDDDNDNTAGNETAGIVNSRTGSTQLLGLSIFIAGVMRYRKHQYSPAEIFDKMNQIFRRDGVSVFDPDNRMYVIPVLDMACVPYKSACQ